MTGVVESGTTEALTHARPPAATPKPLVSTNMKQMPPPPPSPLPPPAAPPLLPFDDVLQAVHAAVAQRFNASSLRAALMTGDCGRPRGPLSLCAPLANPGAASKTLYDAFHKVREHDGTPRIESARRATVPGKTCSVATICTTRKLNVQCPNCRIPLPRSRRTRSSRRTPPPDGS